MAGHDRWSQIKRKKGANDRKRGIGELEGEEFLVVTEPPAFHRVQEEMRAAGVEFSAAELAWLPRNEVRVEGKDGERLTRLLEALEELDDVHRVHSNADIDDGPLDETFQESSAPLGGGG